jgi:DNA recombination protein RmuC
MSELENLANSLLEHAPELTLAIGTVIAIGVIAVIVILLRPRKPPQDPVAEQRMADLNARVQAMGELLARAQSQLQQTVHERLDAVTARLGESMRTSTKDTAEHLQQLHARLAVIDSAQKNITDLASQVTTLQQVLSNK